MFLNNGDPTLVTAPSQNNSTVDITICSPDIASDIEWLVQDETLGSDHYLISIYISCLSNIQPRSPFLKWNVKLANWALFSEEIDRLGNPA